MVGMGFSYTPGKGYYVPVPPGDEAGTKAILKHFEQLFAKEDITWVGQNLEIRYARVEMVRLRTQGQYIRYHAGALCDRT